MVGASLFAALVLAHVLSRVGALRPAIGPVLAIGAGGERGATLAALLRFVAGWMATGVKAIRVDSRLPTARPA